ncbi:U6 snRNA phosphodiesterase Usb1 [Jackrogersella minutella]|nr:U6 snRNA phosphodiesterase Usb1 [Jackrogersella minutella]
MALVDYTSDSESGGEEAATTSAKRQKTSDESAALPPLPAAFHDLYASTVRVSTTDDRTLHQGRKRVNPHKAGNWPSHLYIEWHPNPSQLATLSTLLSSLQPALSPLSVDLTSFLTSDLGAPQPLHISLSRPIVLGTAQKDGFLEELTARIKASGVAPLDLAPRGLEWHRTRESERSFLVLRVGSAVPSADAPGSSAGLATGPSSADDGKGAAASAPKKPQQNAELTKVLQRCNGLVEEYAQPPLYADSGGGDAFHVSIAWSFAAPTPQVKQRTEEVFSAGATRDEILALRVPVGGVKAKIGNVVTHVPLPVRGRRGM